MQELEYCCECGAPTGKAGRGEGSNYYLDNLGPFCDECRHRLEEEIADNEDLRRQLTDAKEWMQSYKLATDTVLDVFAKEGTPVDIVARLQRDLTEARASLATLTARYEALREAAEDVLRGGGYLQISPGIPFGPWDNIISRGKMDRLRSALADAPEALGRRQEAVEEPREGGHEGD